MYNRHFQFLDVENKTLEVIQYLFKVTYSSDTHAFWVSLLLGYIAVLVLPGNTFYLGFL